MSTDELLSKMHIILSKASHRGDRQERPGLIPCRVVFRQRFQSRKENNCLLIILSNALQITEVREIGRGDMLDIPRMVFQRMCGVSVTQCTSK